MRVFKVYAPVDAKSTLEFPVNKTVRREFFTNNPWELTQAPVGALIEVREMTEAEYKAIPATTEAQRFFRR